MSPAQTQRSFIQLLLSLSLIPLTLGISSNKSKHSSQNIFFPSASHQKWHNAKVCVCVGVREKNGICCKLKFKQLFGDITNKNDSKSFAGQGCNCLASAESFWLSSSPLTSCFRATSPKSIFHSAVEIETFC